MTKEEKTNKPSNITHLKSIQGKKESRKEKNSFTNKGTPVRPKSRADLFITDERFKKAMDLIQKDMNRALSLSQKATHHFYFLFQFLIKNGIINENEYYKFLDEELSKIQDSSEKK